MAGVFRFHVPGQHRAAMLQNQNGILESSFFLCEESVAAGAAFIHLSSSRSRVQKTWSVLRPRTPRGKCDFAEGRARQSQTFVQQTLKRLGLQNRAQVGSSSI